MSPDNKKKLNSLRKKLDIIDNQLLKIIKKRSEVIKKVITIKVYKKEIVDKKRINLILKRIKKRIYKKEY